MGYALTYCNLNQHFSELSSYQVPITGAFPSPNVSHPALSAPQSMIQATPQSELKSQIPARSPTSASDGGGHAMGFKLLLFTLLFTNLILWIAQLVALPVI
jgi:hypothetical protein